MQNKEYAPIQSANLRIKDWTFQSPMKIGPFGMLFENVHFAAGALVARSNSYSLDITFRSCTFGGEGLVIDRTVDNVLVADCTFEAGASVRITNARNVVFVNNKLRDLTATGTRNLYICDNKISGTVTLRDNRYLLVDGNRLAPAGRIIAKNNVGENGNNLMDVDARLACGADERLLPQVDKDQFVGMARKTEVLDDNGDLLPDIFAYINAHARDGGVVYVPPGAYTMAGERLTLSKLKDCTIYAYGVYVEAPAGEEGRHNLPAHLLLLKTENVTIKGLTIGCADPASGQIYILEKKGDNRVLAVGGAGLSADFGTTNQDYYNTKWVSWHRMSRGEAYAYRDTNFEEIKKQADGTLLLTLGDELYGQIAAGDILTCRAVKGVSSVRTEATVGTLLKDVTVYGHSGGLCFIEEKNLGPMTYYRVADLARAGVVISKEEYDRYAALEAKYGVDLEISVDERGYFRGSPSHIGSIDATHVVACAGGSQVISCRFEDMCDDGTNQKARHARLAALRDNGDGTTTVVYKGNLSETKVDRKQDLTASGYPADFRVGDRVYIYTAAGRLVCDTQALSATEKGETLPSTFNGLPIERRHVVVPTAAINFAALEGYDLDDDHYKPEGKVLVDNMTRSSNGFLMDNTMVKNTRSRGLLIKSSDGVIKNCTFRNNAKCGVAIIYEIYWGESGISENIVVENNLFDNTSYSTSYQTRYRHAPLVIAGIGGGTVDEEYLAYKNITVTGNKFINRNLHMNRYAIYAQATKGLSICGNDFGVAPAGSDELPEAVCLMGAANVEISDNIYAPGLTPAQAITGEPWRNLYGTDTAELPKER